MAIYSASIQTIKRSAGRSSVAAAAYRAGERIRDERTGIEHDYTRRDGVEATGLVGWTGERGELWNAAEAAERINGRTGRELRVSIPPEITRPEARKRFIEDIAGDLRSRYGVAVDWSIHRPSAEGDQRNYHAHVMFTTREVENDKLGAKTRILDSAHTSGPEVEAIRARVASRTNEHLARAGSVERVDHRSYRRQDAHQPEELQREPTVHLGPSATAMERRGVPTELGDLNRAITARNALRAAQLVAQERAIAAARERIRADQERAEQERAAQVRNGDGAGQVRAEQVRNGDGAGQVPPVATIDQQAQDYVRLRTERAALFVELAGIERQLEKYPIPTPAAVQATQFAWWARFAAIYEDPAAARLAYTERGTVRDLRERPDVYGPLRPDAKQRMPPWLTAAIPQLRRHTEARQEARLAAAERVSTNQAAVQVIMQRPERLRLEAQMERLNGHIAKLTHAMQPNFNAFHQVQEQRREQQRAANLVRGGGPDRKR